MLCRYCRKDNEGVTDPTAKCQWCNRPVEPPTYVPSSRLRQLERIKLTSAGLILKDGKKKKENIGLFEEPSAKGEALRRGNDFGAPDGGIFALFPEEGSKELDASISVVFADEDFKVDLPEDSADSASDTDITIEVENDFSSCGREEKSVLFFEHDVNPTASERQSFPDTDSIVDQFFADSGDTEEVPIIAGAGRSGGEAKLSGERRFPRALIEAVPAGEFFDRDIARGKLAMPKTAPFEAVCEKIEADTSVLRTYRESSERNPKVPSGTFSGGTRRGISVPKTAPVEKCEYLSQDESMIFEADSDRVEKAEENFNPVEAEEMLGPDAAVKTSEHFGEHFISDHFVASEFILSDHAEEEKASVERERRRHGQNFGRYFVLFCALMLFAALTGIFLSRTFERHDKEMSLFGGGEKLIKGDEAVSAKRARVSVGEARDKVLIANRYLSDPARYFETRGDYELLWGNKDKASEQYVYAESFDPGGRVLLKKAIFHLKSGQSEEARKALRSAPKGVLKRKLTELSFEREGKFYALPQFFGNDRMDEIKALGGGSTLTFRIGKGKEIVGAFKPLQTRRQSNYRSEIAAWRFCRIANCSFRIPENIPIKIEYDDFYKNFDVRKDAKQLAYRKQLVDLIWTKEEDGKRYLYGTLKEWISDFTRFPIEYRSLWHSWLDVEENVGLSEDLKSALSKLQGLKHTQKLYREILRLSPTLTQKELAKQLSDIIVFDFLTVNWDRFSGVEKWWGVNCQYTTDRLISIDNGACFQSYVNKNVLEKWMSVTRFNREFLDNLRELDKEWLGRMLFPGMTEAESKKMDRFWLNLENVLERVDSLVEKYGEDRVYIDA